MYYKFNMLIYLPYTVPDFLNQVRYYTNRKPLLWLNPLYHHAGIILRMYSEHI